VEVEPTQWVFILLLTTKAKVVNGAVVPALRGITVAVNPNNRLKLSKNTYVKAAILYQLNSGTA